MFFLFPIGHEDQVVQRLPYITIIIIILNVLVFLFTEPSSRSTKKVYLQKIEEIVTFYDRHPDLDIDSITREIDSPELPLLRQELKRRDYDSQTSSTNNDKKKFITLLTELNEIRQSMPFNKYGLVPSKPTAFTLISSLFIHDGFFHLLFNMLFLWIAGCSIEDKWGRPLFVSFYLISGIGASYAHILMFPKSLVPLVGASGAIAGVMGAFLVRLFKTRIKILYFYWFFPVYVKSGFFYIPAYVALPFWLTEQFYYALLTPKVNDGGGVAFWAHIGGFVFGAIIAVLIKMSNLEAKYIQPKIEDEISIHQHPKLLSAIEKIDLEKYDEAVVDLSQVLNEDPNHPDANLQLAQVYLKQGKKIEAAQVDKKLVSIYLGEKMDNRALSTYNEMEGLSPGIVLPSRDQMKIAQLIQKEGNVVEAAIAYEKLVEAYPHANETLKAAHNAGTLYLIELNQPEKALEIFQSVKELCTIYPEWQANIEEGIQKAAEKLKQR